MIPLCLAVIGSLLLAVSPATAQETSWPVTDLKAGILAHNVPILGLQKEHGVDLNGEVVFASPVPRSTGEGLSQFLRWVLHPAINLGFEANTSGYTSQVYGGFVWRTDLDLGLQPNHALFLAVGLGPALNTGHVNSAGGHLSLGSNVLIHPSVELGYEINHTWSISLFFDHSSNAGLERNNDGLDNLGIRTGLHF